MESTEIRDKYTILKVLGAGTFGTAVLVRPKDGTESDEMVMKLIDMSQMNNIDRMRAMREVSVFSRLNHPCVVSYKTGVESGDKLYIGMEYCDNGDLDEHIKRQKFKQTHFPEDRILSWFVHLCLAVKYIHEQKIIHRDIKAKNIFLTKQGIAKLGDFGIAKILDSAVPQFHSMGVGTPLTISPEVASGNRYNSKCDMWSLGCVLYHMATLSHPFLGQNIHEEIKKGNYTPISNIYSRDLKMIIFNLLQTDSSKRYSANKIVADPFIQSKMHSMLEDPEVPIELKQVLNKNVTRITSYFVQPSRRSVLESDEENLMMRGDVSHVDSTGRNELNETVKQASDTIKKAPESYVRQHSTHQGKVRKSEGPGDGEVDDEDSDLGLRADDPMSLLRGIIDSNDDKAVSTGFDNSRLGGSDTDRDYFEDDSEGKPTVIRAGPTPLLQPYLSITAEDMQSLLGIEEKAEDSGIEVEEHHAKPDQTARESTVIRRTNSTMPLSQEYRSLIDVLYAAYRLTQETITDAYDCIRSTRVDTLRRMPLEELLSKVFSASMFIVYFILELVLLFALGLYRVTHTAYSHIKNDHLDFVNSFSHVSSLRTKSYEQILHGIPIFIYQLIYFVFHLLFIAVCGPATKKDAADIHRQAENNSDRGLLDEG